MLGEISREQQLVILGLILLIVSGLGVMAFRRLAPGESPQIIIEEPQAVTLDASSPKVLVHVSGAVEQEGVYKLKAGDRVVDVLNLAGGATPLADLSSINLAEKVKDGEKISIPSKSLVVERGLGDPGIGKSGTSSSKVNINSATTAELCKVKGIGKTTAEKIVDYRKINGPFSKLEDLMKVKRVLGRVSLRR
ncbi:MAG: helix-hairpin-helix domain-containing protein [bacterium]